MEVKRVPRQDARFQPCLESREIAEYFKEMPIGAMVTYDTLRHIAHGKDVQRGYRYILDTARKIAQADASVVMWPVTGEGMKRLNDSEIVGTGEVDRKAVCRKMGRAKTRLGSVDYKNLEESARIQAITYTGLFASIELVTAYKTITYLKKMTATENLPALEPKQVLGLFLKGESRPDSTGLDSTSHDAT